MNTKFILLVLSVMMVNISLSKNKRLPYREILDTPEDYAAGNIVSRFIDGLGFRYYWATEGLTDKDLGYKPSEKGRTTEETIKHIYELSVVVLQTAKKSAVVHADKEAMNFKGMRKATLENLYNASQLMRGKDKVEVEQLKVVFTGRQNMHDFPFWNLINGPLSDMIYHTGQVISFRRTSGNPVNPNLNSFTGKIRTE